MEMQILAVGGRFAFSLKRGGDEEEFFLLFFCIYPHHITMTKTEVVSVGRSVGWSVRRMDGRSVTRFLNAENEPFSL